MNFKWLKTSMSKVRPLGPHSNFSRPAVYLFICFYLKIANVFSNYIFLFIHFSFKFVLKIHSCNIYMLESSTKRVLLNIYIYVTNKIAIETKICDIHAGFNCLVLLAFICNHLVIHSILSSFNPAKSCAGSCLPYFRVKVGQVLQSFVGSQSTETI